jgi:hypothetical protein
VQYALPRPQVEEFIHERYIARAQPVAESKPQSKQPKKAEAKTEPKEKPTREESAASMGHTAVSGSEVEVVKPKRKRNRRKKSDGKGLLAKTEHTIFSR